MNLCVQANKDIINANFETAIFWLWIIMSSAKRITEIISLTSNVDIYELIICDRFRVGPDTDVLFTNFGGFALEVLFAKKTFLSD